MSKKIRCKKCNRYIDESEMVCPYCGSGIGICDEGIESTSESAGNIDISENNNISTNFATEKDYEIDNFDNNHFIFNKLLKMGKENILIIVIVSLVIIVGMVGGLSSEFNFDLDKHDVSLNNSNKDNDKKTNYKELKKEFLDNFSSKDISVYGIEGNAEIYNGNTELEERLNKKYARKYQHFFIEFEPVNRSLINFVKNGDMINANLVRSDKIIATKKIKISGLGKAKKYIDFKKNLKNKYEMFGYNGIIGVIENKGNNNIFEETRYKGLKNNQDILITPSYAYLSNLESKEYGIVDGSNKIKVKGLKSVNSIKIKDKKTLDKKVIEKIKMTYNEKINKINVENVYCTYCSYNHDEEKDVERELSIDLKAILNINNGKKYIEVDISNLKVDMNKDMIFNDNYYITVSDSSDELEKLNENIKKYYKDSAIEIKK